MERKDIIIIGQYPTDAFLDLLLPPHFLTCNNYAFSSQNESQYAPWACDNPTRTIIRMYERCYGYSRIKQVYGPPKPPHIHLLLKVNAVQGIIVYTCHRCIDSSLRYGTMWGFPDSKCTVATSWEELSVRIIHAASSGRQRALFP